MTSQACHYDETSDSRCLDCKVTLYEMEVQKNSKGELNLSSTRNNVLHYNIQDSFRLKLYLHVLRHLLTVYSKSEKLKCISLLGISRSIKLGYVSLYSKNSGHSQTAFLNNVSLTFLLSKCRIPKAICRAIFINSRSFSAHLKFSYLSCSPGAGLEVKKLSRVPPGTKSVTRRIFSNQTKNSGKLYLINLAFFEASKKEGFR